MKLRFAMACALLGVSFGTFLTSTPAVAQMSDGERKAAARAAYAEGLELQEKGKPIDALGRFESAQSLFDAPTHLLHIAECQALTGKLVEASETYETLARKTLPPGSPDVFVQAQEQGKAELPSLRQRIPTLRVIVKPDAKQLQNLQISVNDKQLPNEVLGIARPVNPGAYRLSAVATGWATPSVVTIDMVEKTPKDVELVLQPGAAAPVAGVVPPVATAPPPYEQPKTPVKESPSSNGLLVGVRGGFFVPGGDVENKRKFENFATAGPGFGVDLIGRVARLFLIGGTLEYAALGAPEANSFSSGTRAEVSSRTVYLGVVAGIMPNVDKVTFVADANVGFRSLSRDLRITELASGTRRPETNETYGGLELGIDVGLSIPAGPLRIVPKAGLAFGQFTSKSCDLAGDVGNVTTAVTGCTQANPSVSSSSHTMFNVVLGIYYHADFSKKSTGAQLKPATLGM